MYINVRIEATKLTIWNGGSSTGVCDFMEAIASIYKCGYKLFANNIMIEGKPEDIFQLLVSITHEYKLIVD